MSKLMIKDARLAFPDLFVADATFNKFGAQLIITPGSESEAAIEAAMLEAAKGKWGEKGEANLKQMRLQNKLCLTDGDAKAQYEGFAGNMALSSTNTMRPTVVNRDRTPLTSADGVIYSGCYVNASVEIWAQDHKTYGKRINCSLRGIQFNRDGEAFSGGGAAEVDEFDQLESGSDADDFM